MLSRRFASISFCLALMVTLGLPVSRKGFSQEKTTVISYMTPTGVVNLERLKDALASFEAEHPNIKTTLIWGRAGFTEKLLTLIAVKKAPDIFYTWDQSLLYKIAQKGSVLDIRPFLERDKEFSVDDYLPKVLEGFLLGDMIVASPVVTDTVIVAYNEDMFDKAGVNYPPADWEDTGWDWNSLVDAASKMTKDIDGDGRIDEWGYAFHGTNDTWSWIWGNGGRVWDDPKNPTKSVFNSPQTVRALQFSWNLLYKYKVALPDEASISLLGEMEPFLTNRVAMAATDASRGEGYGADITAFRWGLCPVPGVPGKQHVVNWGTSAIAITKDSDNPDAAWELVRYLTFEKGAIILHWNSAPTVKTEDPYISVTPEQVPARKVTMDGLKYARYFVMSPKYTSEMRKFVRDQMILVLSGIKKPEIVAETIQNQLNKMIKQL